MSVCICFIVVAFYVSFIFFFFFFFFSSRRRHTRSLCDWSSDVCSSDLTSINHLEDRASSTYHAFQVSGRRQVGGLQMALAYTYSHSIDDSSSRQDGNLVNAFDLLANRASSNFDQRHIFNFSYVWDLPFFRNPGLTNKLLGGWQYSGIVSFG